MVRLFEAIELLDQRSAPAAPAENMARDEALLISATVPVVRAYSWREPAVTFGYFLPVAGAEAAARGRPVMRRWTGGGIVEHGDDLTWSLIVPAASPVSRMRPLASYGAIHAAVAQAMAVVGIPVKQVPLETPAPAAGLCMTAPAPGDLLVGGRKIAGAGQRRSRHGLLHQGTICGVTLPGDFPARLAAALSETITPFTIEYLPTAVVDSLVTSRYGTTAWLRMR